MFSSSVIFSHVFLLTRKICNLLNGECLKDFNQIYILLCLAIGCNIPRNCPILDYRDIPCTGCEPVDDGSCCVGCKRQLPELFGPSMPPYMNGGGMFSNMNGPSHRRYGYK